MPDARLQRTREAYREPPLSIRYLRSYDIVCESVKDWTKREQEFWKSQRQSDEPGYGAGV